MMNVLGLILVATTLATAGVFSPPAAPSTTAVEKGQSHDAVQSIDVSEVIVKEGHRVIVVEYDEEGTATGSTKVSISPPHDQPETHDVKENGGGVKDVVCDAFGKCRDVISSAVGLGKKKVTDKSSEIEEDLRDVADKAAGKGSEMKQGANEAVDNADGKEQGIKQGTREAAAGARDQAVDRVQQGVGMVNEGAHKAKKGTEHVANKVERSAKEATEKAKDVVHDAQDKVTSFGKEIKDQASAKVKQGVEVAEDVADKVADKVKEGAEKVQEEGKQELREIYDLGKQLMRHIWSYLAWGRTLGSVMGLVHLIGFCMAYGMAVWITFLSSNVMSRALPRQQFGVVQSKLYPVYFRAMGFSVGMSLLGHLLGEGRRLWSGKAEFSQGYNLGFALAMVMLNLHYLEPMATKVMFERMREEKEEGRGREPYSVPESIRTTDPAVVSAASATPAGQQAKATPNEKSTDGIVILGEKLKKLNSFSSLANVMSLMSLSWHLVYLSQQVNACR